VRAISDGATVADVPTVADMDSGPAADRAHQNWLTHRNGCGGIHRTDRHICGIARVRRIERHIALADSRHLDLRCLDIRQLRDVDLATGIQLAKIKLGQVDRLHEIGNRRHGNLRACGADLDQGRGGIDHIDDLGRCPDRGGSSTGARPYRGCGGTGGDDDRGDIERCLASGCGRIVFPLVMRWARRR
jgi:hypothetical protein